MDTLTRSIDSKKSVRDKTLWYLMSRLKRRLCPPKPRVVIYVRNGHAVYETTNNINKWRATYTRLTGELR